MDTVLDLQLVRAVPERVQLRADEDDQSGSIGTLSGHFSAFNTWYEIDSLFEGRFLERVVRGAYKKTIRENRDAMKVLYDHGMDFQIGNKVLGPIEVLREDDIGAYYEVPLLDTSYNRDLLPGLRAGVYGASMRFRVIREEWNDEPGASEDNPEGLPERTIKEARVYEFGPVTFPANPGGTASARSLTDMYHSLALVRADADADKDVLVRAVALRQADGLMRPSTLWTPKTAAPPAAGEHPAAEDTEGTRTSNDAPPTAGEHPSPGTTTDDGSDAPPTAGHPSATSTNPPQGDDVDTAIRNRETAVQVAARAERLRVAESIRDRRARALRGAERYDQK